MFTSLRTSRPSWFVRNSWIPMVVALVSLTVMVSVSAVTVGEALGVVSPSGSTWKLHAACDLVAECLLTTHDPIELKRSGILVGTLDCVSARLSRWPASRTGGLVP